jgi:hypothetical protein
LALPRVFIALFYGFESLQHLGLINNWLEKEKPVFSLVCTPGPQEGFAWSSLTWFRMDREWCPTTGREEKKSQSLYIPINPFQRTQSIRV